MDHTRSAIFDDQTMNAVQILCPAKLTLSLKVKGRRRDGYHLIDAEMVSVDLCDELIIARGSGLTVRSTDSGFKVPLGDNNLINQALKLVNRTADVTLIKKIPAGAGLGGGSTNAAGILRWAGFEDPIAAANLGADVAFCLNGGRARVTGIGETLEHLPYHHQEITLLTPPLGVSTVDVYRAWDALDGPVGENGNDLEAAALSVEPELAEWRDALSGATGQKARLAGSGGTWFVEGHHDPFNYRGVASVNVTTLPAQHP